MTTTLRFAAQLTQSVLQRAAFTVLLVATVALVCATIAASVGALPWIEFSVGFGGEIYQNAGQIAQVGLTVLAVLLCGFLPANARIMALETSHRRFNIGMQDVARAYHAAHAADRAGLFRLSSEFDAVRERLAYLRDHPDLGTLEPDLLEVAAQMSHISRELAQVYSDDRITRARSFLTQRQQEVEVFNARLDQAKQITRDLKHWSHEVELEESVAASQLQRLRDELREVLPELGLEEILRHDGTVIDITQKAAE